MTDSEVLQHWNYFRSLDERLDHTRQFIDHRADQDSLATEIFDHKLKNANVTSFEFQQLIILTCVEFEDIAKAICKQINPTFNMKWSGIVQIYDTLFVKYPHIVETEIASDYQSIHPLADVKKTQKPNPDKPTKMMDYIAGIPWWDAYDNIKYGSAASFDSANLENAVLGLASLYVLNLYLMQIELKEPDLASEKPAIYFNSSYGFSYIVTESKNLPDFENESRHPDHPLTIGMMENARLKE